MIGSIVLALLPALRHKMLCVTPSVWSDLKKDRNIFRIIDKGIVL